MPNLNECARQQNISLTLSAGSTTQDPVAISLHWGSDVPDGKFAARIAMEQLTIIVNPRNSLQSVSLSELQTLINGAQPTWSDGSAVNIYVPDLDSDLGRQFSTLIMHSAPVSSFAKLIFDPQVMLTTVASDPSAIGISTTHWVDSTVKAISISDLPPSDLTQPVLIILPAQPEGVLQNWVACLQVLE